jgi:hypothetical protein
MIDEDDEDDEFLDLSSDPTVTEWGTIDYVWAYCPHEGCGKKNWVYTWDPADITSPFTQAMRCFSCGKLSWINKDMRDDAELAYETLDEAFVEDGTESPPRLGA